MKHLLKLEQQIGKYGEKLVASPPPSATRQNQWVVNEIRTILDKKMAEHSSSPELTQHFTELFCGLDKISKPAASSSRDPLSAISTQTDIIDAFDERYFKGQATLGFTTKLLMDSRVTKVDHFIRAVAQGGTILRSWTAAQREVFQLHVANKLWLLGDRSGARKKLASDYESIWRHQLSHTDLPKQSLELLARALVATGAVPLQDILNDVSANWRSLFVFWRFSFPKTVAVDVKDTYLLDALNHVSENASTANEQRLPPPCLRIVPTRADVAPQQIRSALLRHAQDVKDKVLLDLLLASCDSGEDKILEAGVIATKLALA